MKYVVGAIIGAVIGYLTNWLAIKMLFRPHEEKRIFGIKVPFTPGLIPKEQKRIAASVGSAVGEYLLTEETIINNLRSDKVQEHIRTSLKRKVNDICESKRTIGDSFSFILKDNYEKVAEFIKGKIVANVEKELHKPEIQNKILEVSEEHVKRFLEKNPKELEEKLDINITDIIRDKAMKLLKVEDTKSKLQEKVATALQQLEAENITLRQLCSEEIISYAKMYASNNKEKISSYIQEVLKEPWAQEKLRSAVNDAIGSNVNPLVAMFINSETIFYKVTGFLDSYLQEEEKQDDIVIILEKVIDHIGDMTISEILNGEEGISKVSRSLSRIIENDTIISMIVDGISEFIDKDKSFDEIINEINSDYYSKVRKLINEKITNILYSCDTINMISNAINKIANNILNLRLKDILASKKEYIESSAVDVCQEFINEFIHNEGKNIIEILDVSSIVEEEINKFPVDMGEKIIIGIARKELSAITWLGGLLGGLIGILSPVISTLL